MTTRATIALLCAPLPALAFAACGATTSVSTSAFKGEQRQVAQTVAHLQSHATALEAKKICGEDLAAARVAALNAEGGCKHALESQLKLGGQAAIDNFEATVHSVAVTGATATARVESVWSGKKRIRTMTFVREGGRWRISGLG